MWRNVCDYVFFFYYLLIYLDCFIINLQTWNVYTVNIFKVSLSHALFANYFTCVYHAPYSVKVWRNKTEHLFKKIKKTKNSAVVWRVDECESHWPTLEGGLALVISLRASSTQLFPHLLPMSVSKCVYFTIIFLNPHKSKEKISLGSHTCQTSPTDGGWRQQPVLPLTLINVSNSIMSPNDHLQMAKWPQCTQ